MLFRKLKPDSTPSRAAECQPWEISVSCQLLGAMKDSKHKGRDGLWDSLSG